MARLIGEVIVALLFCAGAYWALTHISIKRSNKSEGDKE